MNNEDINEGRTQINLSEELYLTTKDYTRYHFLPANFSIANDTLYGKGTIESSSSIIPFQGSVALTDIVSIEQRTPDTWATIGLITGILAIGFVVAVLIFTEGFTDAVTPD
ncbi:MAG: hypothetical protein MUE91_02925 [Ignavibacteriaceae bacterium]|nr:hypothetical protein [Ignavibacteriaceae bacterium]